MFSIKLLLLYHIFIVVFLYLFSVFIFHLYSVVSTVFFCLFSSCFYCCAKHTLLHQQSAVTVGVGCATLDYVEHEIQKGPGFLEGVSQEEGILRSSSTINSINSKWEKPNRREDLKETVAASTTLFKGCHIIFDWPYSLMLSSEYPDFTLSVKKNIGNSVFAI